MSSVSKATQVPCSRVYAMWARALVARPPQVYSALTVPLSLSIKRCPEAIDGVLADAIVHIPGVRATIVTAIDPFSGDTTALKATCKVLPQVAHGWDAGIIRERANDALQHGCRGLP
jgi:hypothetical protein